MLPGEVHGTVATSDFLVIGGGIIGLSLASNLKRRYPDCSVTLIEKEKTCGRHASGRNSGVLHAGFYYGPDSWKARFTLTGNRALKDYCRERSIPVNLTGKLVVARDEAELPALYRLLERGRANGVLLALVTEDEARRIEPRVKTAGPALYSPETATVDPRRVVAAFAADAEAAGVRLWTSTAYLGRRNGAVRTTRGSIDAGHVVNAAGLHADTVARDFGYAEHHAIMPFKGLYLGSSEPPGSLKTNVYPVPDPDYPFLGAHFTLGPEGRVTLGPTALPALWREQYRGWAGFEPRELRSGLRLFCRLFLSDPAAYARLAFSELRCSFKPWLVREGARLIEGVRAEHFRVWGEAGIRAQLVDRKTGRLESDFRFEGDEKSSHVLNVVSPAFTCALPFCAYLAERIPGPGAFPPAAGGIARPGVERRIV